MEDAKDEVLRLNSNKPHNLTYTDAIRRWTQGKMSDRPEYYAGRGITRTDLNSPILEMFWKGLTEDIGVAAADNFVFMIGELSDLSASAFLNAFYEFFHRDCVWKPRKQTMMDQFTHQGRSDDRGTRDALMIGLMEMMLRDKNRGPMSEEERRAENEAQTLSIKREFLLNHGQQKRVREIEASLHGDAYHPFFRSS